MATNSRISQTIFLSLALLVTGTVVVSLALDLGGEQEVKTKEITLLTMFDKRQTLIAGAMYDFAREVNQITEGKLNITVEYINELSDLEEKPINALNWVSSNDNKYEMLHGASYYWMDEIPEAAFFTSRPFGMYHDTYKNWLGGEGGELWESLYEAHGFNVIPFSLGNTGPQWGGVSNIDIKDTTDLQALKVRMPGLGRKVLTEFGAIKFQTSPWKISDYSKISGPKLIEWIGPFEDLDMILANWNNSGAVSDSVYYYLDGWHEPNTMLELLVNKDFYYSLDPDVRSRLQSTIEKYDLIILSKYLELNELQLSKIEQGQHSERIGHLKLGIRSYPKTLLRELRQKFLTVVLPNHILSPKCKMCTEISSSYTRHLESSDNAWKNVRVRGN